MDLNELIKYGFEGAGIVLLFWLVLRVIKMHESSIKDLTVAINELKDAVSTMCGYRHIQGRGKDE